MYLTLLNPAQRVNTEDKENRESREKTRKMKTETGENDNERRNDEEERTWVKSNSGLLTRPVDLRPIIDILHTHFVVPQNIPKNAPRNFPLSSGKRYVETIPMVNSCELSSERSSAHSSERSSERSSESSLTLPLTPRAQVAIDKLLAMLS